MSLSNTATPKYYGEFREKVLRGEIPVCETISMEMNRIDALIEDPRYWYDDTKVEGWIQFCENELTLTDGSSFHMLDSFKIWGEQVYGWYYFINQTVYRPYENRPGGRYVTKTIKKRLIKKQYLIISRGAAKSMYDETHQAYGLIMDTSTTQQMTTAPTMKQADEVLSPFRTAITRHPGPVFSFLTEGSVQNTTGPRANRQKLASTKRGIENLMTNSILEIVPMTIPKIQGRKDKYATVDEWLSCDIRDDVIGAIEQGASKNKDYLIIATSSEGTIRNGVGDTMKIELLDILKGNYEAPHVSIWWYRLDDIKEVSRPDLWVKANPNLGKTVSYETIQQEVERMESAPAVRNDTLAKRFGIPTEGFTYFFTYEETKCHPHHSMNGMQCAFGADLSRGDDFCAFAYLFPLRGGMFAVKARAYITERTLDGLTQALKYKYQEFIDEGSLVIMPGTILNMMDVYDDVDQYGIDNEYDICAFGYDPYNAKEFVERWERENGPFGIEKVIQGAKTESVPLGEIKNLARDRLLIFDQKIMEFTMGNCVVLEDTNGNRKLMKLRKDEKIDCVAATMDALVAYKINIDYFG